MNSVTEKSWRSSDRVDWSQPMSNTGKWRAPELFYRINLLSASVSVIVSKTYFCSVC